MICLSQFVLRRRTPASQLRVKMWAFPVLTLLTIAAIVAVLVSMAFDPTARSQLLLSLVSLAAVVLVYVVVARRKREIPEPSAAEREAGQAPHRVLVVANETVGAEELLSEVRTFAAGTDAQFFVCVPANPVDTGQAEHKGAVYVWDATQRAAQERLDATLAALRDDGLQADGALGDYRPLVAMDEAVEQFHPDGIVISTHPEGRSAWLRQDLVTRAGKYGLPVEHIVSRVRAGVEHN
jgi:GABA permease